MNKDSTQSSSDSFGGRIGREDTEPFDPKGAILRGWAKARIRETPETVPLLTIRRKSNG